MFAHNGTPPIEASPKGVVRECSLGQKPLGVYRKTGLELAQKGSEDTTLAFSDAGGLARHEISGLTGKKWRRGLNLGLILG